MITLQLNDTPAQSTQANHLLTTGQLDPACAETTLRLESGEHITVPTALLLNARTQPATTSRDSSAASASTPVASTPVASAIHQPAYDSAEPAPAGQAAASALGDFDSLADTEIIPLIQEQLQVTRRTVPR